MEISIKIEDVENFTKKYRNYKLNQIEGGKSNYEMEVFRNIMEESGTKLSDLMPFVNVTILSTNGIVDGYSDDGNYDDQDNIENMLSLL